MLQQQISSYQHTADAASAWGTQKTCHYLNSQQCRNQLVSPRNPSSLVMSLTLSCRSSFSQLSAYKFDLLWKLQLYTILITKIKSYNKSK